jgi:tRNA-uridine 2-sulfurtransferase
MNKRTKAIALLSGGLDSILAIKVLLDQGIDVIGVYFALPFCGPDEKGNSIIKEIADKLGIECCFEQMGDDYLEIVKHPKYGHGTGMNPCIDCKIFMLRRAKQLMENVGADLVVTGEVLNQRPMSQHRIALNIIEKDSGLKGKLLRPLSATFLPETDAEKEGFIDRKKMLSINGRSRKEQLSIAKRNGIDSFIPAAGGCILTDKFFTKKFKDILEHNKNITLDEILILSAGRHFRFGGNKIIVGRNEKDNENLSRMKKAEDYIFELPEEIPGPTTVLQGPKSTDAIELAAALTLRYSDLKQETAAVMYGENEPDQLININISIADKADYYNISSGNKE